MTNTLKGNDELRHSDDQFNCPLLKRKIFWGDCIEVQEIRDDNMDMELFGEMFDIAEADHVCEKCRWCYVNESE